MATVGSKIIVGNQSGAIPEARSGNMIVLENRKQADEHWKCSIA